MDDEQKFELRESINKDIEELKKTIGLLKETVKPVAPDNAIGRLTRMEAINSKSISEETLRLAKNKLGKLEMTLKNINRPEFGICSGCDEPIPFGRLKILPESKMCVKCIDG